MFLTQKNKNCPNLLYVIFLCQFSSKILVPMMDLSCFVIAASGTKGQHHPNLLSLRFFNVLSVFKPMMNEFFMLCYCSHWNSQSTSPPNCIPILTPCHIHNLAFHKNLPHPQCSLTKASCWWSKWKGPQFSNHMSTLQSKPKGCGDNSTFLNAAKVLKEGIL